MAGAGFESGHSGGIGDQIRPLPVKSQIAGAKGRFAVRIADAVQRRVLRVKRANSGHSPVAARIPIVLVITMGPSLSHTCVMSDGLIPYLQVSARKMISLEF